MVLGGFIKKGGLGDCIQLTDMISLNVENRGSGGGGRKKYTLGRDQFNYLLLSNSFGRKFVLGTM